MNFEPITRGRTKNAGTYETSSNPLMDTRDVVLDIVVEVWENRGWSKQRQKKKPKIAGKEDGASSIRQELIKSTIASREQNGNPAGRGSASCRERKMQRTSAGGKGEPGHRLRPVK